MIPGWILPLSALTPLVLAFAGWCRPGRRILPLLAVLALAPSLVTLLFLPVDTTFRLAKGHLEVLWSWDELAQGFLGFTVLGWGLAAGYAAGYLRTHPRRSVFWVCFLAAMSGNLQLILAGDVLSFYTGLTMMGFAAWGLVTLEATPNALRAGRLYLAMVVLGEVLVLPALIYAVLEAGTLRLGVLQAAWPIEGPAWMAVGLLWAGFGIKAGMAPLHFWLPVAHPAAPTPASAVLSGCMIKTGLLGWLRLLPVEGPVVPVLALAFVSTGVLNLVGGGLAGICQRRAKAALAYSSLQAMGMLMLMTACLFWEPSLRAVGVSLIVGYAGFHGLHKVGLFLAAGVSPVWPRARALAWVSLGVLTASYAGVPGLAGDRIKLQVKTLWEAVPPGLEPWWNPVLAIGAALTFALVGSAAWMMRPRPRAPGSFAGSAAMVWILAVAAAVGLPWLGSAATVRVPSWRALLPLVAGAMIWGLLRARPGEEVAQAAAPHPTADPAAPASPAPGASAPRRGLAHLEEQLAGPAAALAVLGLLLIMLLAGLA